jgi:hypothetical protein
VAGEDPEPRMRPADPAEAEDKPEQRPVDPAVRAVRPEEAADRRAEAAALAPPAARVQWAARAAKLEVRAPALQQDPAARARRAVLEEALGRAARPEAVGAAAPRAPERLGRPEKVAPTADRGREAARVRMTPVKKAAARWTAEETQATAVRDSASS